MNHIPFSIFPCVLPYVYKPRMCLFPYIRYLEGQSEIQEAIGYYALAKCYNHAIRLAKNFGLDSDLMPYALKCNSPPLMIDVALYFENKGELEKAVQLYQRAGDIPKALDICFKAGAEAPVSDICISSSILSVKLFNSSSQHYHFLSMFLFCVFSSLIII